jgi:hypothetical protein
MFNSCQLRTVLQRCFLRVIMLFTRASAQRINAVLARHMTYSSDRTTDTLRAEDLKYRTKTEFSVLSYGATCDG